MVAGASRSNSRERVQMLALSTTGAALNRNYKGSASLAMAEASLKANDTVSAEKWIETVLTLQRREDGSTPPTAQRGLAKSLAGILQLERGQYVDALKSIREAQDELSKAVGQDHFLTRLVSLNEALVLEAIGRVEEALACIHRAEPVLRRSIGVGSPVYVRAKQMQYRLEQINSSSSPAPRRPLVRPQSAEKTLGGQSPDFFS